MRPPTPAAPPLVDAVTERPSAAADGLDLRSTVELVRLLNDADASVPAAVAAAADELAAAIDAIVERLETGGRLVYAGAGTSGRLALVDAAECASTFGVPDGLVTALIAGGPAAVATAQEAAEDDAEAGAGDVERAGVDARDAVVLLSASGSTPWTLGAARGSRAAGALTVAVVCADGSPLAELSDLAVVAVTGPEAIAGSTRLKAGTAQKLVLNTISTVSMVRLGRTYGNLMVDVVASNEKLRRRARRTIELATGVSEGEAAAALAAAGGEAKTAIVALLAGVDPLTARARLAASRGRVREALEAS